MNLNDRFPVTELEYHGTWTCVTCGAIVGPDISDAIKHNEWHEELEKLIEQHSFPTK
jgi:hypothetical protein